jgi:hypothetical protein
MAGLPIPKSPETEKTSLNLEVDLRVTQQGFAAGTGRLVGGFAGGVSRIMFFVRDRQRVLFTTQDNFVCTSVYFSVDTGDSELVLTEVIDG